MAGRRYQTSGLTNDPLTHFARSVEIPNRSRIHSDCAVPIRQKRGMEFTTEAKDYNIAQFYEEFHNYLPKVVKVTQGFYGEIVEDTFDRDQVMRIQAVSRQRRVIATKTVGNNTKLISIPTIYNEKLCVVKASGKHNKEKDIFNILKDHTLPLMVQFPKDRSITVGSQTISTNHIPHMELLKTFDEIYLLGNFIMDGIMDQEVVHVPLYLSQLRIAVVSGIVGQPKDKYTGYQQMLDRESRYIIYDHTFGNKDIAEYDPSAIHAHTDSTYCYVEPRTYSSIVSLVQNSPPKRIDHRRYNPERKHKKQNESPGLYEEIGNMSRISTFKQASPQPKRDIDREHETMMKTHRNISDRSVSANARKNFYSPNTHVPHAEGRKTATNPVQSFSLECAPSLPDRKSIPAFTRPHTYSDSFRSNIYLNAVPRGQVIPTVCKEENEAVSLEATLGRQNNQREKTITEVNSQDDVENLTIDEVGDYLKKLNLHQYVERFKEEMIDGAILVTLDKDVLKEAFCMKMIETSRLLKFASSGHVPS